MGASAGALDALSVILPALPAHFPLPILAVVHLPAARKSVLAELLDAKCEVSVREAEEKDAIAPGIVYLAPPDYHLLLETDRRLSLSSEEPENFCRPAIDLLFETAADAIGPGLIGIVLTGANADGARGLRAILDRGGLGLIEDPSSAQSAYMPAAAQQLCPEARVLSLEGIASFLNEVACRA